jgi:signal peptidase I
MRVLREVGIAVIIAVAVFVVLQLNVQSYTVRYSSMLPSIREGDWIMVSKASYFFSEPQRGDVIVFNPPFDSPHPYIKRVIGVPGDTVEITNDQVLVNGIPLEEDYVMAPPNYVMPVIEILESQYFVLGDNRNNSNDSRYGWTVTREDIIGKAWFTYWPADRSGITKHYRYPELDESEVQIVVPGSAEA